MGDVLDAIVNCFDHDDASVRKQALKAFAQVAFDYNENAIVAATALLMDLEAEVRQSAVQALARVARGGDKLVIDAVSLCLDDSDDDVKGAATVAVTKIKDKKNVHEKSRGLDRDADGKLRRLLSIDG